MFAPSMRTLRNHTRARRSLKVLTPHCDGNLTLLGTAERIALSLFVPWAATAKALANLNKLACWAQKQMNLTSSMLSGLLEDMDSMRHDIFAESSSH